MCLRSGRTACSKEFVSLGEEDAPQHEENNDNNEENDDKYQEAEENNECGEDDEEEEDVRDVLKALETTTAIKRREISCSFGSDC